MEQQDPKPFFGGRIYSFFLLVLLLFALFLTFRIISPFLHTIIFAAVTTIIAYPPFLWLMRRMGGSRGLAAALTTLGVCFLIIVPLFFLVSGLAVQGANSLRAIHQWTVDTDFNRWLGDGAMAGYMDWLKLNLPFVKVEHLDIQTKLLGYSEQFAQYLLDLSKGLLRDAVGLLMQFVLLVFMVFFLSPGRTRHGPAAQVSLPAQALPGGHHHRQPPTRFPQRPARQPFRRRAAGPCGRNRFRRGRVSGPVLGNHDGLCRLDSRGRLQPDLVARRHLSRNQRRVGLGRVSFRLVQSGWS